MRRAYGNRESDRFVSLSTCEYLWKEAVHLPEEPHGEGGDSNDNVGDAARRGGANRR